MGNVSPCGISSATMVPMCSATKNESHDALGSVRHERRMLGARTTWPMLLTSNRRVNSRQQRRNMVGVVSKGRHVHETGGEIS